MSKGLGLLGKGLEIQRFEGLIKRGYGGLDTLKRAAFLRPVQIVRQTISNLDMGISPLRPYHRYKGLSSPLQKAGKLRITNHTPGRITNPYMDIAPYPGYKGLADMKV
jgi:hypothetical protein